MTTLMGKGGMVYLQGSGATATKLANARSWKIQIDRDKAENNALGDTWMSNLTGLLKWKLDVDGNLDTAETSPFDAATASTTKKVYLYPDLTSTTTYYYGSIWPTLHVDATLKDVIRFTLSGEGDGALAKN